MILGILTLITALAISAVAIYYSVAGLVAIFAAAALPIMIMGGTLEIAKLVTAVWLHRYWKQATWWLKTYLTTAVVILMIITSMGIFGFLSKAHIEQTAQSTENLAQVDTIQSEIDRYLAIIGRAENKIRELDNSQTNTDSTIQEQIDREQERIDTAYDRVQPLVDEQNKNLEEQIALFGLEKVDTKIAALDTAMNINTRDRDAVRNLQSIVGAKPDGAYGSGTAAKVDEYREKLDDERQNILAKIQKARQSTNEEIARIRQGAENQIAESNKLINRLREQLGVQDNAFEIQKAVDEQNERIRTASNEVDRLTEEKIVLESEYRKLEAEVGPIKYIAEFVYGENADNNMLEEAVRWVIITIIFVFDPLAVLLLIASQYTFEWRRKEEKEPMPWYGADKLYAQKIVDNVPPSFEKEDNVPENIKDNGMDRTPDTEEGSVGRSDLVETKNEDIQEDKDRLGEGNAETEEEDDKPNSNNDRAEDTDGDGLTPGTYSGDPQPIPVEQEDHLTQDEKSELAKQYSQSAPIEKKDIESSEELKKARTQELEAQENDISWSEAKRSWKEDHPNETLKEYKELYINDVIDRLPWEDHLESKKKTYIMKQGNQQIRKTSE